ncbi:MAG: DUF4402 domain-containing protein [Chlorobiaceae bacterium]
MKKAFLILSCIVGLVVFSGESATAGTESATADIYATVLGYASIVNVHDMRFSDIIPYKQPFNVTIAGDTYPNRETVDTSGGATSGNIQTPPKGGSIGTDVFPVSCAVFKVSGNQNTNVTFNVQNIAYVLTNGVDEMQVSDIKVWEYSGNDDKGAGVEAPMTANSTAKFPIEQSKDLYFRVGGTLAVHAYQKFGNYVSSAGSQLVVSITYE